MLLILLGAVLIIGAIFLFTPAKKEDYTFQYDFEDDADDPIILAWENSLQNVKESKKKVNKSAKKGTKKGAKK